MASTARYWGKPVLRRRRPGSDVIVLMRRFRWLRNRFETVASVRCLPGGHGTVIKVTLRTRRFTAAYLSLWLVGSVLVNLIVIYQSAVSRPTLAALPFTLFVLAMVLISLTWGRYLARGDGPAMLDFIRDETGAEDLAPELRPVGP